MYGLDANIIPSPFSAMVSILLIIACDFIGLRIISNFLKINIVNIKWIRWQAPIIGAALLSVIVYPLALIGYAFRSNLRILAIILLAIALIHIIKIIKLNFHLVKEVFYYKKNDLVSTNIVTILVIILIIGYALLSLAPVTSADSLGYHIGVSIEILNTGAIFRTPEWFHSHLSGNGEVLNALGLSVGAEQFGSLLQFSGLLAITGLFLGSDGNSEDIQNHQVNKEFRMLLALIVLSTPILVFLVGTSKFQLLPVSMTTLALSLIIFPSRRDLSSSDTIKNFLLVIILVMVASQAKINYLLSGGLIGIIAILFMFYKKLIWQSTLIGLLAGLLILFPAILLKSSLYELDFLEVLFSPIPINLPGVNLFQESIRNAQENKLIFPISLLIPSSIGGITTVIGIGVFSFILIRPSNDNWIKLIVLSTAFIFIFLVVFGPSSSRSYLEPYLWCLLAILLQNNNLLYKKYKKNIKFLIIPQSLIIVSLVWFGVISLMPGAISTSLRENVMDNSANGYTLMKWVDRTLPKDAIVISTHRSISLIPRKTISIDWMNYIHTEETDVSQYLNIIKEEGVSHLLTWGYEFKNTNAYAKFSNCFGKKLYGPKAAVIATRNPFHTSFTPFNAWIVELNSKKLPQCYDSSL
jgi:hypothetical protein